MKVIRNSKKVKNNRIVFRLVAADALRKEAFEVYELPMVELTCMPSFIAYKSRRFYYVYLYENRNEFEQRHQCLSKSVADCARILNAGSIHILITLQSEK